MQEESQRIEADFALGNLKNLRTLDFVARTNEVGYISPSRLRPNYKIGTQKHSYEILSVTKCRSVTCRRVPSPSVVSTYSHPFSSVDLDPRAVGSCTWALRMQMNPRSATTV